MRIKDYAQMILICHIYNIQNYSRLGVLAYLLSVDSMHKHLGMLSPH